MTAKQSTKSAAKAKTAKKAAKKRTPAKPPVKPRTKAKRKPRKKAPQAANTTPAPPDPSKPLTTGSGKWEQILLAHFENPKKTLTECVRAAGYSEKSAHQQATRMSKNVEFAARLAWLRRQTASDKIATVNERKEILTRIMRSVGNADPSDYGAAGADGVWWNGFGDDTDEQARGAIAGWKSRTDEDGSVIQEIKLRPYSEATGAIKELNAMEGEHAATNQESTGPDGTIPRGTTKVLITFE